jgi:hypothetical protein
MGVLDLEPRRRGHDETGHRLIALIGDVERDRLGAFAREELRRREDVRGGGARNDERRKDEPEGETSPAPTDRDGER